MTNSQQAPAFSQGFPPADHAKWRAAAQAALKGAPFDSMVSTTLDGIEVQPLYERVAQDRPRPWRGQPGPWRVCARVDDPDPVRANAQLRDDLANGANAIHLVFAGSAGAHGFGLPPARDTLETVLDGVDLGARIPVDLDAGADGADQATRLADMLASRRADPATCPALFGLNPLGHLALTGATDAWDMRAFSSACLALAARGFGGPLAVADGRLVDASGGAPAQELAYVVAAALAYLRALEGAGVPLESARAMIGFRLGIDADEFAGVAKCRALRRLWANVESACGLAPAPIHIHAETSWRMMTRRDPWTNILRATIAVFSAGVGGANAISVLPFTQAIGLPDGFARRVARNTQLVLIEEANLGRVADPAAGAGGFEALTDALCARAWDVLQSIEAEGGLGAALVSGSFQRLVQTTRAARQRDIAAGQIAIIGATAFKAPDETPVATLAPMPASPDAPASPRALAPMRDAQPFE